VADLHEAGRAAAPHVLRRRDGDPSLGNYHLDIVGATYGR
jgi:hypothetical protein